jgi:cell division protein FtsL
MKVSVKVTLVVILVFLIILPSGYALTMNTSLQELKSQVVALGNQLEDYQSQVNDLLGENASIRSEIANFQSFQGEVVNLKKDVADLKNKIEDLKKERNEIKNPKIVTYLGTTDVRTDLSKTRFYMSGRVWNTGIDVAYNCSLHVTLYRGDSIVNDSYVKLGDLHGASWLDVDTNIHYSGSALTNWTIIPEFTP